MVLEIIDKQKKDEKFVKLLERDFPEVRFRWRQKKFAFRMQNGQPTVFLGQPQPYFALLALHELGHGLSRHYDYSTHIHRIKIECEAWERAKTVFLHYKKMAEDDKEVSEILPEWNEDFVQEKMDTYRDWLHVKSKCKKCSSTMYQTNDGKYHCPQCDAFSG